MRYDILADWTLNTYCNLSCPYCFLSKRSRKDVKKIGHSNIRRVIDFFNDSKLTWLIHMSGGEPFIYPKFVELCQGLTEKHYISINTNLTLTVVNDFIKKINPNRVAFINCSLHYDERKQRHSVDFFTRQFKGLKEAGFNCFITQVFYSPTITRFKSLFDDFKIKGLTIRPKVFRGYYNSKHYPESYTEVEKKLFMTYSSLAHKLEPASDTHIDPILDQKFIDGELSFKGIPCNAGKKSVYIKFNGDIVRCHASNKPLGNIFRGCFRLNDSAEVCPFTICPCPYYGLRFTNRDPIILKQDNIKRKLKHFGSYILDNINAPI
jgi:MoaA/NifB/PqqE/SkfB family radical SAM enzyme